MPREERNRQFKIYRIHFPNHYEVRTSDNKILLYGENSVWTPGKPDLILYAGSDKSAAPIVGVCEYKKLSDDMALCLGNPDDPLNATWESMDRTSLLGVQYHLTMSVEPPDLPEHLSSHFARRRTLVWKKTHKVAVQGKSVSSLTHQNYKLIDAETRRTVAVFTASKKMSIKSGTLQIVEDYGRAKPQFFTMIILSCLSLYEKVRRAHISLAGASVTAAGAGAGTGIGVASTS